MRGRTRQIPPDYILGEVGIRLHLVDLLGNASGYARRQQDPLETKYASV
jgi:hypothetical protein